MRISDWSSDVCSSDLLGGVVAASAWVSHPQCLGDPSALIDEDARRLWLGNVREARPIYRQPIQTLIASMSLPFLGLIGFGLAIWENRRNPARPRGWLAVATLAAFSLDRKSTRLNSSH